LNEAIYVDVEITLDITLNCGIDKVLGLKDKVSELIDTVQIKTGAVIQSP